MLPAHPRVQARAETALFEHEHSCIRISPTAAPPEPQHDFPAQWARRSACDRLAYMGPPSRTAFKTVRARHDQGGCAFK